MATKPISRGVVALAAFVLLTVSTPILSAIRNSNSVRVVELTGWESGIVTALLMGSWGWIVLILSKVMSKYEASRPLIGLGIVHFVLALIVTGDMVLNGNSTAGVALFLFPALMAPVNIICAAGILISGRRPVQTPR